MRTHAEILAFTCAGLFVSDIAIAGDHARLELSRESGATACPEEKALSDAVGARLGYVPFLPTRRSP